MIPISEWEGSGTKVIYRERERKKIIIIFIIIIINSTIILFLFIVYDEQQQQNHFKMKEKENDSVKIEYLLSSVSDLFLFFLSLFSLIIYRIS